MTEAQDLLLAEQKQSFLDWFDGTFWEIESVALEHCSASGLSAPVHKWLASDSDLDAEGFGSTVYAYAQEDSKSFGGLQTYQVTLTRKSAEPETSMSGRYPSIGGHQEGSRKVFTVDGGPSLRQDVGAASQDMFSQVAPMLMGALNGVRDDKVFLEKLRCASDILREIVHKEGPGDTGASGYEKLLLQTKRAATYADRLELYLTEIEEGGSDQEPETSPEKN